MSYTEFKPHPTLRRYIDAYWTVKTLKIQSAITRVFPDGCVDIIMNPGSDFITENGTSIMRNDHHYLVGTMTLFIDTVRRENTHLIGVRFKPLGFTSFFRFSSLHELTNTSIELEQKLLPEIQELNEGSIERLNSFFLTRLPYGNIALSKALDHVKMFNGVIKVTDLAKNSEISKRQLERDFMRYVGVTPKEYINFVRYQSALEKIQNNQAQTSLLDIAFATGYYDHSHMTNEIKKYSGLLPSQW